jgi:hypothetical protein
MDKDSCFRAKWKSMKTTKTLFCILTITAALAVQVQAQSFLTNGLMTYYPFNGNADDATGNGHDGTVMGATLATNRFGQPQSAYAFDGTSSVIVVTNSNDLQPLGDFSVSLWAQIPVVPDNTFLMLLAKHGNRANDSGWVIDTASQQFPLTFQAAPLFNGNSPQVSIPTNAWFQATFTYQISSQTCNFYINGVLADSRVQNYNTNSDPNPFTVGAESASFTTSGYDFYFKGMLDDIRIYNRVLSSNEVAQLYAIESIPPPSQPYLDFSIALNISKQSGSNVRGTVSTTASPTRSTLTTKDILNMLALDENVEGSWPRQSFPRNATLALAGNSVVVLNGTNILLNVSDLMSFHTGEPKITSGKQNTVTGLATATAQELQIAGLMFDDTFINGGGNLKFYLNGVLSKTTTDTTPVNGFYTETQTLILTTAAGDGSSQDVPFICTGSVTATGKSPLHL